MAMEVPVFNRMTKLEATHSFTSRIVSFFDLPKLTPIWKWGPLFLALLYAFTSMAYRIKLLFLHYRIDSNSLLQPLLPDFDDDEEEEDCVSSSSSVSEEEEEERPISSSEDLTRFDGDFRVKGKFKIRRRRSIGDDFSLTDLVTQNGVVKLWDGSFSPSVIFSTGSDDHNVQGLSLWDFRTSLKKPALQAAWWSDRRDRVVGVDAGKVYVREEGKTGEIGDVRKLDTPLEKMRVDDIDMGWEWDPFA